MSDKLSILTYGAAKSAGGGGGTGDGDMKKAVYDTNNDGVVDAADNATKVNNHTVDKDVPSDAKFTDTVYDDTSISNRVSAIEEVVPSDATTSNKLATMSDIPSLTDYVQKSQTAGLLKNDGTVDTNTYAQSSQLPSVATSSAVGLVKPDGSSITVDANGVLTAVGGGSSSYSDLTDQPQINSVTLSGNKSSSDLGLASSSDIPEEMPASDMDDVVTPLPSVMSRRFHYSTQEQVVGTWIDGKPLYQKTIYVENFALATSWKTIDTGITDVIKPIDVYGTFIGSSDNFTYALSYGHDSSSYIALGMNSSNYISIRGGASKTGSLHVTVVYTKTTD